MAGGEAYVAAGFDYRMTSYERDLSDANQNATILFLSTDTPYGLERDQFGAFAEALLPVTDSLEVTASVRYDLIGATESDLLGNVGDDESDITYKVQGKWDATDSLSLRASYGTGFKAPSMRQIAAPQEEFGVTSGNFDCPFGPSDELYDLCVVKTDFQAHVYLSGNAELKPETSTQYSAGMVFAPNNDFSITVDYWNIEMEDLVDTLTEQQIFDNPVTYREMFTSWHNNTTGEDELAIIQARVNIGESSASGIDYRIQQTHDLSFGELTWDFGGTYMLENQNSLYGSSLGKFGSDDQVTFRNIIKTGATLTHGNFSHHLGVNYRSGYADQAQEVTVIETDGSFGDDVNIQLQIPSYTTVDFQSQYLTMQDKLKLTLGINNLTDKEPPMTLRTSGAGHQVGFDPRYSDAYGRTVYLQAGYTF